jgi:hypothetical protein
MSLESAAAFFDKAIADTAVQNQIMSATAGKEPRDKAAAVADLGKSLGFDFTADEAILIRGAARKALIDEGKLDEELDDLDLQAVTGGSSPPGTVPKLTKQEQQQLTAQMEEARAAQEPKPLSAGDAKKIFGW